MTTYRVELDGETVYEGKSKRYDRDGIPVEYRNRPPDGSEIRLYVNDELIGVQVSEAETARRVAAAEGED